MKQFCENDVNSLKIEELKEKFPKKRISFNLSGIKSNFEKESFNHLNIKKENQCLTYLIFKEIIMGMRNTFLIILTTSCSIDNCEGQVEIYGKDFPESKTLEIQIQKRIECFCRKLFSDE